MRNIVVFCDGTWNTADQESEGVPTPTNVVKLRNCLASKGKQGEHQVSYYHPGVGTEGGIVDRLTGGLYGRGISQNIQSAYEWLARTCRKDDRIFLFGFSRGAYTVRSLGGMLSRCGLLKLTSQLSPDKGCARVTAAYERCYREKQDDWAEPDWPFVHPPAAPIHFIGVWDTVGALGIPDDLAILNLLDKPRNWMFHDTKLGKNVAHARHAVALDEMRGSYTPTLWTTRDKRIVQRWFPGAHSDVGGGYAESGLSDVALKWMLDEAAKAGLGFDTGMTSQIRPDPLGYLHRSNKGVFKRLRSQPRPIPVLAAGSNEIDPSGWKRHQAPPIAQAPYHPTTRLEVDDVKAVDVFAIEPWNDTGIYLDTGRYLLAASGQWLDKNIPCGPGGASDRKFHRGEIVHAVGTAIGAVERLWNRLPGQGDAQADFKFTRRHEDIPWFALTGVVAHELPPPGQDGTPSPYPHFLIGERLELTVTKPGYLYAYANDAWDFYDNNRGSVHLTVKRLA